MYVFPLNLCSTTKGSGVSLSSIFKELMYNYICLEVLVHNSIGGAQCGHSHIVWVSMSFTVGVPGIVG